MFKHTQRSTLYLVVTVAMILAGPLAREGRGDFVLWDDEQLTVNTSHSLGALYDSSTADVRYGGYIGSAYVYNEAFLRVLEYRYGTYGLSANLLQAYYTSTVDISGGSVNYISAYNSSTVGISGGSVSNYLYAYDSSAVSIAGGSVETIYGYNTSTVDISGGSVNYLCAEETSTVDISGGEVKYLHVYDSSAVAISGGSVYGPPWIGEGVSGVSLHTYDTSTVDISGGSVNYLSAYNSSAVAISGGTVSGLNAWDSSVVTFHAREFRLGEGLSLDGDRVLGAGVLSGEWFDGTRWAVDIGTIASGATILAIPEPATLLLLSLGGLALIRRQRRQK